MPSSSSANSLVLLQFGDNPFTARFEDLEGRAAVTLEEAASTPNIIVKLTREAQWADRHEGILGPSNSYLYFGPSQSPGYVVYGNNRNSIAMAHFLRQNRENTTSRHFTAQSGKDYKWRITPTRMELISRFARCPLSTSCSAAHDASRDSCVDGRTTLAVWEVSHPDDEFHAKLTIRPAGIPIVTEIVTTLVLNRMAQALQW
ncbi:hypothetical protein EV122DRAFT_226779 [Schizophyllum commune]|nr:hypothetical protein K523DRAFT_293200 [Schizophyllum commune Tattone D]